MCVRLKREVGTGDWDLKFIQKGMELKSQVL
jgi:hypothetical protein